MCTKSLDFLRNGVSFTNGCIGFIGWLVETGVFADDQGAKRVQDENSGRERGCELGRCV